MWAPIAYRFPDTDEGYYKYLLAFDKEYDELSYYLVRNVDFSIPPLSRTRFSEIDRGSDNLHYPDNFINIVNLRMKKAQEPYIERVSELNTEMDGYVLKDTQDYFVRYFNDYIVFAKIMRDIYEVLADNKLINVPRLVNFATKGGAYALKDPARILEARCYIYECKYLYSESVKN
jgi:hypothetical protein